MALNGVHVSYSYAGARVPNSGLGSMPVTGPATFSQKMATPGTTTQGAPPVDANLGVPIMTISPSADVYVAIGPNPDAVNGWLKLVRAGADLDISCNGGDKLAWTWA